jgi:aminocarboxymuconate-semialdehyde decarboxylase
LQIADKRAEKERIMPNRREFLKGVAGASAGALMAGGLGGELMRTGAVLPLPQTAAAAPTVAPGGKRREVRVGGKRVKTVDAHCHVGIPEVAELLKGTPLERAAGGGAGAGGPENNMLGPNRVALMDQEGIDVEAVSINAFWYGADRDLATKLIDFQNQKLAAMCAKQPDRFVGFTSVALQFPDLAAEQLETGIKKYGLRGGAIGGSVNGEELSLPKYDPFWAKAQELDALLFMHPQDSANATGIAKRVGGNGALGNVIGNPLETTIFLSHLIMEGVFDRFPNLKIMAAHGGGYLPSYVDRLDHGCLTFPPQCKLQLKKKPSEYFHQIYVDSLVFSPEALRHLIAVCGVSQIGIGTDYPFPWTTTPVDHILETPGLKDAERAAMLGDNMCKLLNIPGW